MNKLSRTSILSSLYLLCSYSGYSQFTQYSDYEPTLFEGYTVVEQIYSPGLEGNLLRDTSTQPVKVYLPPSYDDFPENEYPVLYLLGGYTWDHNAYYDDHQLFERLNEMISRKIIVPMIVVTPNAKNKYDGSSYVNSYVTGNWEGYIVQDVIQGIENKYSVLKQPQSRGLSGFSGGGYGATILGMKHSSLFNSVCIMAGAKLDFEDLLISPFKEHIINAAKINEFRKSDRWEIRAMIASAADYAPDSTAIPLLGRFPYNKDSVFIDSIWQKWLLHDPITLLETYKDSLLTLDTLQMYIGDEDRGHIAGHESFHQALLDHGIEHGYEVYHGDHTPGPGLKKTLGFFSENLAGVVPTIRLSGEFKLEKTSTLKAESDKDGKIYIVPMSTSPDIDSIFKYQVASFDDMAHEEIEIQLSEYDFGKYNVYAVSNDGAVSNIHGEFYVVPDTTPPVLSLVSDSVNLGNSIRVSINRDGKICLHTPPVLNLDTLHTVSEIMNSSRLIESADALADSEVSFSTDGISEGLYWIYGFDQYGIVTGPISIDLITSTGPLTKSPLEIMLFPNPAKGIVTIQSYKPKKYDIAINSLKGQLLYTDRMEGPTHQIDLSSFEKGLYFITIRSRDFMRTEKIIKL